MELLALDIDLAKGNEIQNVEQVLSLPQTPRILHGMQLEIDDVKKLAQVQERGSDTTLRPLGVEFLKCLRCDKHDIHRKQGGIHGLQPDKILCLPDPLVAVGLEPGARRGEAIHRDQEIHIALLSCCNREILPHGHLSEEQGVPTAR